MDRREVDHQWWTHMGGRFSADQMQIEFEWGDMVVIVPAKWSVCGTCEGRGSHVNPSIDAHGISPEEFAEDPDFEEAYLRGDFDQPCNECGGRTTVPEPDLDRCTPNMVKAVEEAIDCYHRELLERESERRYRY